MKKIYYLLAALTMFITACQKQPDLVPSSYKKTMNLTLQQTDYQLLPKADYPYYTYSFDNTTDANTYIPVILNARDPQLGNGSVANVTYTVSAPYLVLADSVYKDVAYTLTNADYALLPGNKYTDFSISQILAWLPYKYPNAVPNQLALLTFNYYNSPTTSVATFSFLYIGGVWKVIYTVSSAQYASLGLGGYDQFTGTQAPNLPGYLNALLKGDPNVSATATYGQLEYVSFGYYGGGSFQRVIPLVYNGTDWVNTASVTNTLNYIKSGGTWIPNPTVYYTLTTADTKLIAASTIGTAAERTNLGQYGDFSGWSASALSSAMILVLTTDFPSPKVNIDYDVTYLNYTGGADVPTVLVFQYNGTAWVAH
ncbi:MAG TPA: hypothetical protein VGI43_03840 [Mucilaginibacter sp.]